MGTGGLQNPDAPHLVVGDTLPNAPVADAGSSSSDGASGNSSGEGMGESLTEAAKKHEADKNTLIDIKVVEDEDLDFLLKAKGQQLVTLIGSAFANAIEAILLAMLAENKALVTEIKDIIFATYDISLEDLKFALKQNLSNAAIMARLREVCGGNNGNDALEEDLEKELKIQNNENIEKDIEELEPPIDPEYFPNNMGINLCSVKKEKWVQQEDGQLKTITIEFDPATEEEKEEQGGLPGETVEESLTEASDPISRVEQVKTEVERDGESPITVGGSGYVADLIIIRKVDNKYTAIGHTSTESGNEDDYEIFSGADEGYFDTLEDLLKYLLDDGWFDNKDNSKYVDFSRADIEQYLNSKNEDLNEATLDYYTQKAKMQALNNGTRGFNAKASSDEKLRFNRRVCQNEGYNIALDIIEAEMVSRGLIKTEDTRVWKAAHPQQQAQPASTPAPTPAAQPQPAQQAATPANPDVSATGAVLLRHNELTIGLALLVNKHTDAKPIIDYCMAVTGTIRALLYCLIIAICLKKDPAFINQIKEFLTVNCSYTDAQIRETIKDCLGNAEKIERVNVLIKRINDHNEGKNESLEEGLDLDENTELQEKIPYDLAKALETDRKRKRGTDWEKADFKEISKDEAKQLVDEISKDPAAKAQVNKLYCIAEKKYNNKDSHHESKYCETLINGNVYSYEIQYYLGQVYPYGQFDEIERLKWAIDLSDKIYLALGDEQGWSYSGVPANGKGDRWYDGPYDSGSHEKEFGMDNLTPEERRDIAAGAYKEPITGVRGARNGYFTDTKMNRYQDSLNEITRRIQEIRWAKRSLKFAQDELERAKKKFGKKGDEYNKAQAKKVQNQIAKKEEQIKSVEQKLLDLQAELEALKNEPGDYVAKKLAQYQDAVDRAIERVATVTGKPVSTTESLTEDDQITLDLDEATNLEEAKRYVKRYYVRPQNIFCSNKEDILKALLRVEGENCSIYSLKDLADHDDVQDLKPSDIIYYYDDGILYDKNHVKVMDYDLNVKHEEERKKFADVDAAPSAQVNDVYDDRLTDADLQDKETVANFRAINARQMK